jgi:hypothetical protein
VRAKRPERIDDIADAPGCRAARAKLGEKGAQALFGELQALERLTSLRDLRTAADLAA